MIIVIGSNLCSDTMGAVTKLKEEGMEFEFHDISASLDNLKEYLELREKSPLYVPVKAEGRIGIPCFIKEDGTETMGLDDILKK